MNLSVANGWGIVRTVVDVCLRQPEGRYILVKDPNKVRPGSFLRAHPPPLVSARLTDRVPSHTLARRQPMLRLYSVPDDSFRADDDAELDDELAGEDE